MCRSVLSHLTLKIYRDTIQSTMSNTTTSVYAHTAVPHRCPDQPSHSDTTSLRCGEAIRLLSTIQLTSRVKGYDNFSSAGSESREWTAGPYTTSSMRPPDPSPPFLQPPLLLAAPNWCQLTYLRQSHHNKQLVVEEDNEEVRYGSFSWGVV